MLASLQVLDSFQVSRLSVKLTIRLALCALLFLYRVLKLRIYVVLFICYCQQTLIFIISLITVLLLTLNKVPLNKRVGLQRHSVVTKIMSWHTQLDCYWYSKTKVIRITVFHQIHFCFNLLIRPKIRLKFCHANILIMPQTPEKFAQQNILRNCFNKIKCLIIFYWYVKVQPPNG